MKAENLITINGGIASASHQDIVMREDSTCIVVYDRLYECVDFNSYVDVDNNKCVFIRCKFIECKGHETLRTIDCSITNS